MMSRNGFPVSKLHGELRPEERDIAMREFREGSSRVLITTNVFVSGVPAVTVVVNYDLPTERLGDTGQVLGDCATYLRRITRCGIFGRKGMAVNFIQSKQDEDVMLSIEQHCSPSQRMTTNWNPKDIEGLALEFARR